MTAGATTVKLTDYANGAGCASKMGAADLSAVLAPLPTFGDPRLLVGRESFDDAAIFKLSDDLALVQTVDFFAPIVDDPYLFGQVAAANALSDVYAMGGQPLTAMNIVAFPAGTLPNAILTEILRGGQDKIREAGAVLVGGHTVIDTEVKYGVSVTGKAHPDFILSNAGATPGDRLVLTKPIGTGVLTTAAKRGELSDAIAEPVHRSMTTLNGVASRAALAAGSVCATDITGFSLVGHASHIARASEVTVRLKLSAIPTFEGLYDAIAARHITGGGARNMQYVGSLVDWGPATDAERAMLTDPQTSGGLLVALRPDKVEQYLSRVPGAVEIGEITEKGSRPIVIA